MRAFFAAWVVGALVSPLNTDASIEKRSSVPVVTPDRGNRNPDLGNYFWQYGKEIQQTYLSAQAEEREARKRGTGMQGRSVVFGHMDAPKFGQTEPLKNLLSLFFNDPVLLEQTLGKTMKEVSWFERLDDSNVEEALKNIFASVKTDRSWLRQTVNGRKVPYSDADYERYEKEVERARAMLFLRLQDSRFRSYLVERFNFFLPALIRKQAIGNKTLQTVLTGIAAMSDAAENAQHIARTGKSLSQNPMAQFDQASQIARLVSLVSDGWEVLRVKIGIPNSKSYLVYYVAQSHQTIPAFGNTMESHKVDPKFVMNELIRWMKWAVESAWKSGG